MDVYALIGSSGTGKSYKAIYVANEKGINTIIDDGLLICNGKKVAGYSAKREETMIKAVKRAIFLDKNHAKEVKDGLKKINPSKILILGTSQRMIERITKSLQLPATKVFIDIKDISTEIEIIKAQKMRNNYGKHIIPIPTIEIKKDFPNYFMDSLKFFINNRGKEKIEEKTIIRPKFSMHGKLIISEHVIEQLSQKVIMNDNNIDNFIKSKVIIEDEGVKIFINIRIKYVFNIPIICRNLQYQIKNMVENLTGLTVLEVNLYIKSINLSNF